ncbi:TIGR04282 family arsenosugar biosynthesis glycosyltransferase [Leptolyngbya sp. FACHB-541]|nr:TIGR04282 family arsenosugar biosynthesis glycosyltransferase [Leptolyngbya sp. FACHB-541]
MKLTETNHLIVFTRYPEVGKTKTRLIPALGAAGAAALQRQMTEFTLKRVEKLAQQQDRLNSPLSVEIRFAGGDRSLMQDWLGSRWSYQPQATGDLGERMRLAFQSAFETGSKHVVTIGIDCPELDSATLAQAFQALQEHDLVLGPATDGGYYLIGLRSLIPELFSGIDWGTDQVFWQTMTAAEAKELAIATLAPLTDVDHPEDLPIWEATQA